MPATGFVVLIEAFFASPGREDNLATFFNLT
jgi:hypothetical protein